MVTSLKTYNISLACFPASILFVRLSNLRRKQFTTPILVAYIRISYLANKQTSKIDKTIQCSICRKWFYAVSISRYRQVTCRAQNSETRC